MDYLNLIRLALADLFPGEDFSAVAANVTLNSLGLEDSDTSELGISVENVLLEQSQPTPPDLDSALKSSMTIQEAANEIERLLGN